MSDHLSEIGFDQDIVIEAADMRVRQGREVCFDGAAGGADEDGGQIDHYFIDEALIKKSGVDGGAAFDQQVGNAAAAKLAENGGKIQAVLRLSERNHFTAGVAEGAICGWLRVDAVIEGAY